MTERQLGDNFELRFGLKESEHARLMALKARLGEDVGRTMFSLLDSLTQNPEIEKQLLEAEKTLRVTVPSAPESGRVVGVRIVLAPEAGRRVLFIKEQRKIKTKRGFVLQAMRYVEDLVLAKDQETEVMVDFEGEQIDLVKRLFEYENNF